MSNNTPIADMRGELEKITNQLKAVLPPHVSVEKFKQTTLTAIAQNQKLANVNRKSLLLAAMDAATDGLLPNGHEAVISIFKGKAAYIPMIAGIYKMIYDAGDALTVGAHLVYKEDKFRFWVDNDGEHIEYEPNFDADRTQEPVKVFAMAKSKSGAVFIEVMTQRQIADVRSMASQGGAWSGKFKTEMWRKTVVKRLAKRLQLTPKIQEALDRDNILYDLKRSQEQSNGKPAQPQVEGEKQAQIEEKPAENKQSPTNDELYPKAKILRDILKFVKEKTRWGGSGDDRMEKEQKFLSTLIAKLNEKCGTNHTELDQFEGGELHYCLQALREKEKQDRAEAAKRAKKPGFKLGVGRE